MAVRLPGATGIVAALLASSCCILPLLLIVSGIAGAGIMMSMMRYEWITLPFGTVGLWRWPGESTSGRGGVAKLRPAASLASVPTRFSLGSRHSS